MEETKFREGDLVRATINCWPAKSGETYTLVKDEGSPIGVSIKIEGKDSRCFCHWTWKLVSRKEDPLSLKTFYRFANVSEARGNLRVGDRIKTNAGGEYTLEDEWAKIVCIHDSCFYLDRLGHGATCSEHRGSWVVNWSDSGFIDLDYSDDRTIVPYSESLTVSPQYYSLVDMDSRLVIADGSVDVSTTETYKPKKSIKQMLRNLTAGLKRIFNPDLQAQYRAGLIESDSTLTSQGRNELMEILAQREDNRAALTARANEIIAEAEAKKDSE